MKIRIKKLEIENFKGIKKQTVEFGEKTTISGRNKAGKTTVYDSALWLLFGKNSSDEKKFDVKPQDEEGNDIHHLTSKVVGIFEIDDAEYTFAKEFKENWVKPNGQKEQVLKGNTVECFINTIPLGIGEYKKRIADIIDEELFKLLTSVSYFNVLPWKKKREMLQSLVEMKSNKQISEGNEAFENIVSEMKSLGIKTLEEYKKSIANRIKKSKKNKEELPARIDEQKNTLASLENIDFDSLALQKASKEKEIESIDSQLQGGSKAFEEYNSKKIAISNKETEIESIESRNKSKISMAGREKAEKLQQITHAIDKSKQKVAELELTIISSENESKLANENASILREEWKKAKKSKFEMNENAIKCPCCGQDLPLEDKEVKRKEMSEKFESDKSRELEILASKGKSANFDVQICEKRVSDSNEKIKTIKENLVALEKDLKEIQEKVSTVAKTDTVELIKELEVLKSNLVEPDSTDRNRLEENKKALKIELNNIQEELSKKSLVNMTSERIEKLEGEFKIASDNLAKLEIIEMSIDDFQMAIIKSYETNLASKFERVTFRMFKEQINGGIAETCDTLVDGVNFDTNLNNGHKVLAGIDIINTFSKHHGISCPMFVDNKESLTEPYVTNSQVIELIAKEDIEGLEIKTKRTPTQEEYEGLEAKLGLIRNEFSAYTRSLEDFVDEDWEQIDYFDGEHRRWSYSRTEVWDYKGIRVEFNCDMPATEQQDGQDTSPTVYIVK